MYRGFEVSTKYIEQGNYDLGVDVLSRQEKLISEELAKYIGPNGIINGGTLEAAWFPQIKADIFISHAHADERIALSLSGWVYNNFGLTCFVDSAIWKHADSLLKKIDNQYCFKTGAATYDYNKRNRSTAHVHVMLSAALTKMMHECECLFFLNTPNSISPSSVINKSGTNSPWLYYEILMSKLIRRSLKDHEIRKNKIFKKALTESREFLRLDINYPLDTFHLDKLTNQDLKEWKKTYKIQMPKTDFPLDILYSTN